MSGGESGGGKSGREKSGGGMGKANDTPEFLDGDKEEVVDEGDEVRFAHQLKCAGSSSGSSSVGGGGTAVDTEIWTWPAKSPILFVRRGEGAGAGARSCLLFSGVVAIVVVMEGEGTTKSSSSARASFTHASSAAIHRSRSEGVSAPKVSFSFPRSTTSTPLGWMIRSLLFSHTSSFGSAEISLLCLKKLVLGRKPELGFKVALRPTLLMLRERPPGDGLVAET